MDPHNNGSVLGWEPDQEYTITQDCYDDDNFGLQQLFSDPGPELADDMTASSTSQIMSNPNNNARANNPSTETPAHRMGHRRSTITLDGYNLAPIIPPTLSTNTSYINSYLQTVQTPPDVEHDGNSPLTPNYLPHPHTLHQFSTDDAVLDNTRTRHSAGVSARQSVLGQNTLYPAGYNTDVSGASPYLTNGTTDFIDGPASLPTFPYIDESAILSADDRIFSSSDGFTSPFDNESDAKITFPYIDGPTLQSTNESTPPFTNGLNTNVEMARMPKNPYMPAYTSLSNEVNFSPYETYFTPHSVQQDLGSLPASPTSRHVEPSTGFSPRTSISPYYSGYVPTSNTSENATPKGNGGESSSATRMKRRYVAETDIERNDTACIDEDGEQSGKVPKLNKDGTLRKKREPRQHLRKWDETDLGIICCGLVWVCGEQGFQIPFDQVAQLLSVTCTGSALQQALLKLYAKFAERGIRLPRMKMNWPKKNSTHVGVKVRDHGKLPRRKPTMRQMNQCLIITLKRAYSEADRFMLPAPFIPPVFPTVFATLTPSNQSNTSIGFMAHLAQMMPTPGFPSSNQPTASVQMPGNGNYSHTTPSGQSPLGSPSGPSGIRFRDSYVRRVPSRRQALRFNPMSSRRPLGYRGSRTTGYSSNRAPETFDPPLDISHQNTDPQEEKEELCSFFLDEHPFNAFGNPP